LGEARGEGGTALGEGAGATFGEGTTAATAGLGDGVDSGVGEGICVAAGVGNWLAGAAAISSNGVGDGPFVAGTEAGPAAMAATTIAISAKGATRAET